jgi:TolB-like protein/DNA-binding winged helix-turn-helix (wHTH) protein/tetratricopeptide (TPR) repeat protein
LESFVEPQSRTATPARPFYRFGVFELDLNTGELRKQGMRIRIAGQPLQILELLLERRGAIVTREDLHQKLWAADTFVDFDVGLASALRKLRETLGDSADNPQFIETLPRRGYRFIAPIQTADPASEQAVSARPGIKPVWLIAAAAVLLLLVAALVLQRRTTPPQNTTATSVRTVAVLPFENLTGDPSQEYFVDAMTDLLTTNLAEVHGLRVISRTSANQYKGVRKTLPMIGKQLHADALVEGTIARAGDHLRMTVQLIDVSSDRHLWAHSYEADQQSAARIQPDIVRGIAGAIGAGDKPSSGPLIARRSVRPEAFDKYLKGIAAGARETPEAARTAVTYFEEATAAQPDFADAYAALGHTQLQLLYGGPLSPHQVVPKAEAAARKAIELDDHSTAAHRTLGSILHTYYWRWEEGDKELQRARQFDPDSADSHRAGLGVLVRSGRFEEAIAEAERIRALDPLSVQASLMVAGTLRTAGKYERAIAEYRKALAVDPHVARAHFQLGVTFVAMGRWKDAIDELKIADQISANPRFEAYLAYVYAATGRADEARRILARLQERARKQYVSSFGLALIHDALGDAPAAIAAFDEAFQDHAVELSQMKQYPPFHTIASDPRYQAIVMKVSRDPSPH